MYIIWKAEVHLFHATIFSIYFSTIICVSDLWTDLMAKNGSYSRHCDHFHVHVTLLHILLLSSFTKPINCIAFSALVLLYTFTRKMLKCIGFSAYLFTFFRINMRYTVKVGK